MRSDRIRNMANVQNVQMLVIACLFNKDLQSKNRLSSSDPSDKNKAHLVIQVVQVFRHEDVNVAHNLQDVQALLQRLAWQVRIDQLQPVLLLRQLPHLRVGSPIMQGHRGQIVECLLQILFYIA